MDCKFNHCGKLARVAGYCNAHYHQKYRGEELRPLRQPKVGCTFFGCQRRHQAKGLCSRHYQQQLEGKTPHEIHPYRDSAVSYSALHTRLRRAKGSAASKLCVGCDGAARDWAYIYGCPNERQSEYGPYSTDIDRYQPMCRPCHKLFDINVGLVPT